MYSPQINPGLTPLQSSAQTPQFSLYSPRNIVQSSQPVRQKISEVQVKADELERQINDWKLKVANSPFNNI